MGDNNILLMRVLKIHYKDRLLILDEALKVIKEYSNKPMSSQSEYDITSLTLQSMLNDLPGEILKYFLTMVPLPKNQENLEKNKDDSSNIRNILLNYLNEEIPPLIPLVNCVSKTERGQVTQGNKRKKSPVKRDKLVPVPEQSRESSFRNTVFALKKPIPRVKRRGPNRGNAECKKLLDICAEYLVNNRNSLGQDYQAMKERAWRFVNENKLQGLPLESLYVTIRDLNKKIKWMRLMDSDDVTDELIKDEYGRSEVFVKEKHLDGVLDEDPFEIKDVLRNAVDNFVGKLNKN